jgi:hypothetical protein
MSASREELKQGRGSGDQRDQAARVSLSKCVRNCGEELNATLGFRGWVAGMWRASSTAVGTSISMAIPPCFSNCESSAISLDRYPSPRLNGKYVLKSKSNILIGFNFMV